MREKIDFTPDYGSKATQSIIKVIGVGGGGSNAVKHMYKEGIIGVDFLICNTDRNALEASPIPLKLVLGESGLGAGANPEVARQFALDSRDEIIEFIGTETKMLFITAGMGKGTGTGAAPVIAEIAKELGILTIAVVTLPFRFEGTTSAQFAEAGVTELKKYVDSLITIKNQNIIKYYNDEELDKAFGYADDVLKNAVKCIAELITINLEQNIDFNDIYSIMKNSGAAMLGIAEASGENRINEVIESVLRCPLLTEEHISNARNFLFSICYGSDEKLRIFELEKLTDKFEELKSQNSHVIWGRSEDPSLGNKIKLSVIISKYATDAKDFNAVGDFQKMYKDEKQQDAQVVDKGTTIHSPSSPLNMRPIIEEKKTNNKNDDDEFGFLNNSNFFQTKKEIVEETAINSGLFAGPQKIRSTYELTYEDDQQFSFLIDTPAIQRLRQDNKEDFQDKAIQNNHSSFMLEDDVHEFFKNLPD
ncbi:MAG: cell division protein FtsZ [Bacteroidales bacterium]|jgi:cell division protein FtsZ|nr:cell division protein FtsZ [Bacteroidales bacterium]